MARLPFGNNPFAEPAPSVIANTSRPTPSTVVNQSRPTIPPLGTGEKQDKNKKRDLTDAAKNAQGKRHKTTPVDESPSDSVATTFGSIAAENFSEQDVKILKGRKEIDEEFHFKMGLGDAFFHGLNVLAQKNATIKDQEKALKKFKAESLTFHSRLDETQKKLDTEVKARKDEVDRLQISLGNLKLESENTIKSLEVENQKLRDENDKLSTGMRKGQSEAYNVGFLDYLRNFLAADPTYNWSTHFAPSTPSYMLKFQADNAELIEAAKNDLRKKIESELKAAEDEEARKKETSHDQNTTAISPTQTTMN